MQETYCFDDVLLVPQMSRIRSRSEIDLSTNLGKGFSLRLPIISSPMSTVTETAMAVALGRAGGCGILHRYCDPSQQLEWLQEASRALNEHPEHSAIGFAIETGTPGLERALSLFKGVSLPERICPVVCIDVAHGHHILVKETIEMLREAFGISLHIMAGNIATAEAYCDLSDWGANSVRVSIGSGATCTTRLQTGHGIPTFQAVLNCSNGFSLDGLTYRPQIGETKESWASIIADGGIRNAGDCTKSLAAGAQAVMLGSLLAGTEETPGVVYGLRKQYCGMASKEAQTKWRGWVGSAEGVSAMIPYKGPVANILKELEGNLRSGFSYSGAPDLRSLQKNAQFVLQTPAGLVESGPHIL